MAAPTVSKLVLTLASFLMLVFPALARGGEVMDLQKWSQAGMPESLRQKMVIQSLSQRSRPPLSGEFILEMVRYGGENLALQYVALDSATAQEAQAPLSEEVMHRLMESGVPRADIEKIVRAAQAGSSLAAPETAAVPPVILPAAEIIEEDLTPPQEIRPPAAPRAPQVPSVPAAPAEVPSPNSIRKVPQVLYPGQQADPARPMPAEPGPYHIRRPSGPTGVYLGVGEEVKPDGHVYQVNTNGRKEYLGAEVLSRPSGHKVHRFFSGRTDLTRSEDYNEDDNRAE